MRPCYKTTFSMHGPQKEHWMHLCELIAEEQDPARFAELTKQLLAELEAKERQLKKVTKKVTKEDASSKPANPARRDRSSEDTPRP